MTAIAMPPPEIDVDLPPAIDIDRFRREVLDTANGLSSALRAYLVELAEESIRHGARVLQEDVAVDPLLAVNRSVIERLQPSAGRRASRAGPVRPALAVVGDR